MTNYYYVAELKIDTSTLSNVTAINGAVVFFLSPIFAIASDRAFSRLGERKTIIIVCSFCFNLTSIPLLYLPHWLTDSVSREMWVIGWTIVNSLFGSICDLNWNAMALTLTSDYDERSDLFGTQTTVWNCCAVAGTFTVGWIPMRHFVLIQIILSSINFLFYTIAAYHLAGKPLTPAQAAAEAAATAAAERIKRLASGHAPSDAEDERLINDELSASASGGAGAGGVAKQRRTRDASDIGAAIVVSVGAAAAGGGATYRHNASKSSDGSDAAAAAAAGEDSIAADDGDAEAGLAGLGGGERDGEEEDGDEDSPKRGEDLHLVPTFMRTFRNRPFTILLGAQLLCYINPINARTQLMKHYAFQADQTMVGTTNTIEQIVVALTNPLLVSLSKRIGKREMYAGLLMIWSAIVMGSVLFVDTYRHPLFWLICIGCAITGDNQSTFAQSLLGDVVDYDQLLWGGMKRAAVYSAAFNNAQGLDSITDALQFGLMARVGFTGEEADLHNPRVQNAFRWACWFSAVPSVFAAVVVWYYPINSSNHAKIITATEARAAGETVIDPVTESPLPGAYIPATASNTAPPVPIAIGSGSERVAAAAAAAQAAAAAGSRAYVDYLDNFTLSELRATLKHGLRWLRCLIWSESHHHHHHHTFHCIFMYFVFYNPGM